MPSIRHRQRVIAQNFISSSGLTVDDFFTWQEFFLAASPRMAGSVLVSDLSGSVAALGFPGGSSTCPLWVKHPVPQNLAVSAPASGSGLLMIDWTNNATNSASLTVTACVMWIPPGSAVGDVGTCTLGSGCVTVVGTTACELQSSSLFQFATPASRLGWWGIRAIINTKDNSTTACPVVLGYRLQHKVDRLGS